MDMNSVQSEFTDGTFPEQPAVMSNTSPLALFKDDPEFDWKEFKDLQPLGQNTEPHWNSFQMDGYVDGYAQRVLHQQQYIYQNAYGVPEPSYGAQYAFPPATYFYQPSYVVPSSSHHGQYAAASVPFAGYMAVDVNSQAPAAPTTSTASESNQTVKPSRNDDAEPQGEPQEPQVYIKKPLTAFNLFLKDQMPIEKRKGRGILSFMGTMWKSMSKHQKEKYYKEAEEQRLLHKQQNPSWSIKDNYGRNPIKGKRRKPGRK